MGRKSETIEKATVKWAKSEISNSDQTLMSTICDIINIRDVSNITLQAALQL